MKPYKYFALKDHLCHFYNDALNIKAKAASRRHLILSLNAKTYDFAIAQKEIILYLEKLNVLDLSQIAWIPDPIKKSKQFHILVRKSHPKAKELISIINTEVKQLDNSGQLKVLWQKNSAI
jgi:ABC-type amino acid transport substrate-binding protein